jgi:hypothetical protein
VCDRPTRREFSSIALALLAAGRGSAWAWARQDKDDKKADAAPLPGPEPIPQVTLLPKLPTTPVRRGGASYNIVTVDSTPLPKDRASIWVLDFAFKPLRMKTVDVPGKGRKQVHYLWYRVVNRTGKPREFVPQFVIVTEDGKRFEETVLPNAVPSIQAREDPSIHLLGAVEIAGVIPPSTKENVDDAVFAVSLWDSIDPKADRLSLYVRGLSDGYQEVPGPDGKSVIRYKTLRIDFIRRGDELNLHEKEISRSDPPYEWSSW